MRESTKCLSCYMPKHAGSCDSPKQKKHNKWVVRHVSGATSKLLTGEAGFGNPQLTAAAHKRVAAAHAAGQLAIALANPSAIVTATEQPIGQVVAPNYVKQKARCKMCARKSVDNTVLCREHLEGYVYACDWLAAHSRAGLASVVRGAIKQQKG